MSNQEYFNLERSSNDFKEIMNIYKNQKRLSLLPNKNNVINVIAMKKSQAIQKETSEEYFIQEMKNSILLNEEMNNLFGLKANKHQRGKEMNLLKHKIEKKNKIKKERFLQSPILYKNKLIKKKLRHNSSNIIILPPIFPTNNHKTLNKEGSTSEINKNRELTPINEYSNIYSTTERKRNYLQRLDLVRNQFRLKNDELNAVSMKNEQSVNELKERYKIVKKNYFS